jgi:hypothetical protein
MDSEFGCYGDIDTHGTFMVLSPGESDQKGVSPKSPQNSEGMSPLPSPNKEIETVREKRKKKKKRMESDKSQEYLIFASELGINTRGTFMVDSTKRPSSESPKRSHKRNKKHSDN